MRARKLTAFCLATAACLCTAACSLKFGFVDDSSDQSSRGKKDNSFISEILSKGYSSTDMGETYTLDGDFSMLTLHDLSEMYKTQWLGQSDGTRYETALNLLNFWAYYGDDTSIRYKPSELVSGITDKLSDKDNSDNDDYSVLDAALDFAVAENKDKYLALIGVIDIEDAAGTDNSSAKDK